MSSSALLLPDDRAPEPVSYPPEVVARIVALCEAEPAREACGFVVRRGRALEVLQIPNAQWYNIPAGPVCAQQFTPPPQPTVTPPPIATATPVPGPTPTPGPVPQCRFYHVVRHHDTLYGIAWRYGSTVPAIASANAIANINLIYVGTTLCIP